MNRRIAKFDKVSFEQFYEGMGDVYTDKSIIRELYDDIVLPVRSTKGSAGYDFCSPYDFKLAPGETIKIPTGIRCEMYEDWVLLLFPRSSLGFKYQMGMCNTIPVVDADYAYSDNEGHIFVKLVNRGDKTIEIKRGDKFVQGIFLPYGITEDDNTDGIRNGGFGSTGR